MHEMHLILALLVAAAPSTTDGTELQRDRANRLVQQGNEAFTAGRLDEATSSYEQARSMFPSPKILYNLAQVHEAAGRLPEAYDAYAQFVGEVAASEDDDPAELQRRVERAREQMRDLERRIGTVVVHVQPPYASLHVDGVARLVQSDSVVVRLLPGRHEIVAAASGRHSERHLIEVEAGGDLQVSVSLKAMTDSLNTPARHHPIDSVARLTSNGQPAPHSRLYWWALAVTSVALIAGALVLPSVVSTNECKQRFGCL